MKKYRPDLWDDGGTPMWRARQEREWQTIDVSVPRIAPRFRRRWRRASVPEVFLYTLLLFGGIAFGLIFGGFLFLIVYDQIQQHGAHLPF